MQDYSDLTKYIERAKANDEEAFVRIYEMTYPTVYNIACVMMQDTEEAKDIVSEVFIRVFRHLSNLRDNQSFIRWLTVITHNVCTDHLKAAARGEEKLLPELNGEMRIDDIEEWHQKEAMQSTMQKLLHLLPEAQQRAVHYVYFNQLSLGQAAALENCSINTIKSRLYYARETLRRAIEKEEKRTGDKLHLSFSTVCLASLMALPQAVFPLTPDEAASIFSSVLGALGVEYAVDRYAPRLIVLEEQASEMSEEKRSSLREKLSFLLRRKYLLKFSPLFVAALTVFLVCTAILLIGIGGARRGGFPYQPQSASPETTAAPAETEAFGRSVLHNAEYTYEKNEQGITLLAIKTAYPILEIPAELDGYALTGIADGAFAECVSVTTLRLPGSLQNISGRAIADLTELREITVEDSPYMKAVNGVLYSADMQRLIAYPHNRPGSSFAVPSSVRVIGEYAVNSYNLTSLEVTVSGIEVFEAYSLAGCTALASLRVPNTTHTVGENAFACPSLADIKVYAGSKNFYSVSGALFNHEKTELIRYPAGKTSEVYQMPGTTTQIAPYAFFGSAYLTEIRMPDSVTKLSPYALSGLPLLKSVIISPNIEALPAYCLADNPGISEYVLPLKLRTIDAQAMAGCTNLHAVIFEGSLPELVGGDALVLDNPDCIVSYPEGDSTWAESDKLDAYIHPAPERDG